MSGTRRLLTSHGTISKKDVVFLDMAKQLGSLGTCDRAQVGCIITVDGRAVSWGYNGAPPGLPHCDENGHGWGVIDRQPGKPDLKTMLPADRWSHMLTDTEADRMPWDWKGGTDYLAGKFGCRNVTHAELNALCFAARQGSRTEGGTCYVTLSSCATCARALVAAGIKRVVWAQTYRDPQGSEILEAAGIEKVVILPDDGLHV